MFNTSVLHTHSGEGRRRKKKKVPKKKTVEIDALAKRLLVLARQRT